MSSGDGDEALRDALCLAIVRREEDLFDMGLLYSPPLPVATIGLMAKKNGE